MFPAYAGMIRLRGVGRSREDVFPAYAGMIRPWLSHTPESPRVPRLRGDDPIWRPGFGVTTTCSPPTRG